MEKLLKFRVLIIACMILLTVIAGLGISRLTRDAGASALLAKDNEVYLYTYKMEDLFGAVDQFVFGLKFQDGVFTPKNIGLVRDITDYLKKLEDIKDDDVTSLTSVKDIQGAGGFLEVKPLIKEGRLGENDMRFLFEKVKSNPLFYGKLVSLDMMSTVILAPVDADITLNEEKLARLTAQVEEGVGRIGKRRPDAEIYISGMPVTKTRIAEYMKRDLQRLFPLALVVVAVMMAIFMQNIWGVLLPMLVTVFSIVWAFGIKGYAGSPITIAETIMPVMLIATGCADGVHIISEFMKQRKMGLHAVDAASKTVRTLAVPCILTSVTTAMGFASLATAPGVSIRNLGFYLAIGVMAALPFSLIFIPSVLSFSKKNDTAERKSESGVMSEELGKCESMVGRTGFFILKYRIAVVAAAAAILVVSILGVFNITVESDEMQYFREGSPLRSATEKIQDSLGGIVFLDIIIEGREPNAIKNPELLGAMLDLQKFCEGQELVSYAVSIADYVKRMNYVVNDDNPAFDRLPRKVETVNGEKLPGDEQVAQLLLLYEMGGGEVLDKMVDADYKTAKISVLLKDTSTRKCAALLEKLTPYVKSNFPKTVDVKYSNYYMRYAMAELITQSQINSFCMALAMIFLVMSIIYRSPVNGFMMSFAAFVAIFFNFAVMWIFGVTLNIGTSIIAAAGMGVGIDYSIHIFLAVPENFS